MNKAEFIDYASKNTGVAKRRVTEGLETISQALCGALHDGESVDLHGIGKFSVKVRAERAGRHPVTGERIVIPSRKMPVFKPGKRLTDAVKEPGDE